MLQYVEITPDEAAFYKWWDENYAPSFATVPGAMQAAFVEIAQNAWMAAMKNARGEISC